MLGATPTDTKYLTAPHLGYQATIKDLIVNLSIIDIRRGCWVSGQQENISGGAYEKPYRQHSRVIRFKLV
jgi:hypothetical protein